MNNYEIKCDKYNYISKINKPSSYTYIFELILSSNKKPLYGNKLTKRNIIKSKNGRLLSEDDNIPYCQYKDLMLTIIDADNINSINTIKGNINNDNIICNDMVYLEINQKNNILIIDYKIID